MEDAGVEPSFLEGLRDLLGQPEFTQGQRILGSRTHGRTQPGRPSLSTETGAEVKITIGGEHPIDAMRLCSVITAHYTGPAGLSGTLSVVGPTRMHYPRAVSMVRYMSSLMEELLGVYFA